MAEICPCHFSLPPVFFPKSWPLVGEITHVAICRVPSPCACRPISSSSLSLPSIGKVEYKDGDRLLLVFEVWTATVLTSFSDHFTETQAIKAWELQQQQHPGTANASAAYFYKLGKNFQVFMAFANAFQALQPLKAPAFRIQDNFSIASCYGGEVAAFLKEEVHYFNMALR